MLRMSRGDSGYKGTVPLHSISTDLGSLHLKTARVQKKKEKKKREKKKKRSRGDILHAALRLPVYMCKYHHSTKQYQKIS